MSTTRDEATPAGAALLDQKRSWLAAGGLLGAILASACCVGPLPLLTLGIFGAWIGNLTALEPYKPFLDSIALIFIGLGFWHVYFRPHRACEPDSYCARPGSAFMTKAALWGGAALVIAPLTIDRWAPLFY